MGDPWAEEEARWLIPDWVYDEPDDLEEYGRNEAGDYDEEGSEGEGVADGGER